MMTIASQLEELENDTEKEELKAYMDIVPDDEFAMKVVSLATKAVGSFKNYKIFSKMLDDFDRQDVMDLHGLVEERYTTTSPEGYDLMLWGDLKILFESDEEDEIWRNQHEYNLISWRLFDSCGIHILLMDNRIAIHILVCQVTSTKVEKCLEESSQSLRFNSEKLDDLRANHKFRGGLLGIKGFYKFILLVSTYN
ncbi:hypothetical protein Tco_0628886 [Tanacetum coccineum]|uniref:Uncharacterized protein n=1 Tax=Tanacetum coccineum TaxID=301880 RepID=A0ABQ4WRJ4_9ASTR